MEFKLECFELSGLVHDFSALPHHDQYPKDYQIKILADEGLAFDSSWVMGINDEDTSHICWPDDIALECDPPLVGMRLNLEVICRTIDKTCTSIFKGDLQVESWDGIIDAILGVSESRDIVRSFDAVSNTMTATTIVGVPMHKLRADSSPVPASNKHHTTMFIRISIKAVPLEALDSPLESPIGTPVSVPDAGPLAVEHNPENVLDDSVLRMETVTGMENEVDVEVEVHPFGDDDVPTDSDAADDLQGEAVLEQGLLDEEVLDEEVPLPPKEDIAQAVESIVPFVAAPTPPPPPPPVTVSVSVSVQEPAHAPVPAPPAPAAAHPVLVHSVTESGVKVPAAPSPSTVPPPPPAPKPPTVSSAIKDTPPVPSDSGSTINTEAALHRAHAPAGRHHKSRASFVFVPSAEEDTQGIPLEPLPVPAPVPLSAAPVSAPVPSVVPPPLVPAEVPGSAPAEATSSKHGAAAAPPVPPAAAPHRAVPPAVPPPPPPTSSNTVFKAAVATKPGKDAPSTAAATVSTSVEDLQRQLKSARDENTRLKAELRSSENLNKDLQRDCEVYQQRLKTIKAEYDDKARVSAQAAEAAQKVLTTKLTALQEEVTNKASLFATLTAQLEAKSEEVKKLSSAADTASSVPPSSSAGSSPRSRARTHSDGSLPLSLTPFSTATPFSTPHSSSVNVIAQAVGSGLTSAGSFTSSPSERIAQRRGTLATAFTMAAAAAAAAAAPETSQVPEEPVAVVNHTPLMARLAVAMENQDPFKSFEQASSDNANSGTKNSTNNNSSGTSIKIPSSSLPSLFPSTDEGDYEDAELAPVLVTSKFRPKSHSIRDRTESLSQLDNSQAQLQAALKAEIEKKTPRERLRQSNDAGLLETSSWALGAMNSPVPPSATPPVDSPVPMSRDGAPTDTPPPSLLQGFSRKLSTRDRHKDSTADLHSAAAQAAAMTMADDKRQSLISQGHSSVQSLTMSTQAMNSPRDRAGFAAGPGSAQQSVGLHMLKRTLNTAAGSQASHSRCSSPAPAGQQGTHSMDSLLVPIGGNAGPPSAGSSVASRSPNPAGLRRIGSTVFSRRLTTGEGSNFGGEGAINGLNGTSNGNNGIDDDEIAYTIRELTASLRMSPSIDSMQNGSESDHDRRNSGASPVQTRVMQRMMERRRSSQQLAASTTESKETGQDKSAGEVYLKGLPELLEPSVLAAQAQLVQASSPSFTSSGASVTSGAATGIAGIAAVSAGTVVTTFTSVGRASLLAVPGSAENPPSLLQARFGRARFSRTASMHQDARSATTNGGSDAASRAPLKCLTEEQSSSSESKTTDTAHVQSQRIPSSPQSASGTTTNANSAMMGNSRTEAEVEQVSAKYARKSLRVLSHNLQAHASAAKASKFASLGRSLLDTAGSEGDNGHHEDVHAEGENSTFSFLHFPLELTQRDYLRKLFEILGDGLRGHLISLFQVTEHLQHHPGGLFGGTPTHHPHHRHSTGGPAPGDAPQVSVFPLAAAQRYDAIGLLNLLLDSRFNFKLRPFVCSAGGNIPSNEAYAEMLRCCEALLAVHTDNVCALVEHSGRSGLASQAESGQLLDMSGTFDLARSLLSAVYQASVKAVKHPSGVSVLNHDLAVLQDLQTQMGEHRLLKEQRMTARRWRWEGTSTLTTSSAGISVVAEVSPKSLSLNKPSELLSPIPVVAGRRASAFFSPDSQALEDPRTPGAQQLQMHDKQPEGSSAFLRRSSVSAVVPSRRTSSASPHTPHTPHTPPALSTHHSTTIALAGAAESTAGVHSMNMLQDKESILIHLFRRTEATVAHLMVGVLPSNIAVIELMVSFSEIHEVLKIYQEHHRKSGHREEAQFLRGFAEVLQQQLEMDLSTIGAFKTSQQAERSSAKIANNNSTEIAANALSPVTTGKKTAMFSPEQNSSISSPQGTPLTLTQGPTIVDTSKKHTRKGAAVSTAMLDQIYIELDDMAAAMAEKKAALENKSDGSKLGLSGLQAAKSPLHKLGSPTATSVAANNTSAVSAAAAALKQSKESKEALIAAKKEAWSYTTAPVDIAEKSGKTSAVRIHHKVQSGHYLLEHMNSLVTTSDELITQLEDCRNALVTQRNREYNDVDHELSPEQLRLFVAQEERIAAAVKELVTLSTQIKHKLSPLHLTHNEELIGLLSTRGMMGELANKLLSMSLTVVNAGHREHIAVCVATLLIRSKSTALVHSVYQNWPQLTLTIAVITAESVDGSVVEVTQNRSLLDMNGSVVSKTTPAKPAFAHGYKQPYTLDFASTSVLTSPRGRTASTGGAGIETTTPKLVRTPGPAPQTQQVVHVTYHTTPACEIDIFTSLDFSSTRSLRLLGFTLHQLRDSKCFDLRELLSAGYPLSEVKNLKTTLYVNITAKDLRLAGYTAHECLNVGFDVASLRAGGFDDYSLVKSGLFNVTQLRSVGCDIQRIALMSLFESLDGKHWRHKENWASAAHPIAHWYGVHLDGAGHVWKIDLRGNGLKGKLPPALSLLTSLQHLDLYNNLITGDVPEEYAALTSLRDLYLGNTTMDIDRAALHAMLPNCKLRL